MWGLRYLVLQDRVPSADLIRRRDQELEAVSFRAGLRPSRACPRCRSPSRCRRPPACHCRTRPSNLKGQLKSASPWAQAQWGPKREAHQTDDAGTGPAAALTAAAGPVHGSSEYSDPTGSWSAVPVHAPSGSSLQSESVTVPGWPVILAQLNPPVPVVDLTAAPPSLRLAQHRSFTGP